MRVLLVDDDEITLEVIGAALRRRGFEVDVTTSGGDALEVLAGRAHRVVVCDWEMPGLSGPELCAAIRSSNLGGRVYTILLTGRSAPPDVTAALSAGADEFIAKPVKPDDLAARIRAAESLLSQKSDSLGTPA